MLLRLKKVHLQNFGSVRDSTIEFPEYGMVLVRGVNDCARGKLESSGSGKTLMGEALCRTVLGVEGRFKNYGWFSNDHTGNKETLIEVEGTLDKKPIAFRSGFKHDLLSNTGEGLAYKMGKDWISRGHMADTRTEISTLLGVTPEVASWTVYIDGDQLKFSKLGQTALVDLVLASLNQPPWTEYADKATKRHTRMKGELSVYEETLAKTVAALERANRDLDKTKAEYEQATADRDVAMARRNDDVAKVQAEIAANVAREEKLVNKKKKLKRTIKQHEDERAVAYAKFETQRLEIKAELAEARRAQSVLDENRSDAKAEVRRLTGELEDLDELPDKCPTCKQKWDHSHDKKGRTKIENELKEAREHLATKVRLVDEGQTAITALESKRDKLDDKISAQHQSGTEELSEEYEECERKLSALLRDREQLNEDLAMARRFDETDFLMAKGEYDRAQQAVEGTEEELRDIEEKTVRSRKDTAISAYLRTAFGPTGIPNMVLQEAIVPLNESSRLISGRMTGNSISVSYSTTRELVSGKTRSELLIKTDNKFGAKRAEGSSKGEGGLTNLIVAETIAEMSNVSARIGFRWYDEVLRNPDVTMRRNFFSYVADLAERKKLLCFVVDHDPEAANFANYILVAHKTPKGTRYYWDC